MILAEKLAMFVFIKITVRYRISLNLILELIYIIFVCDFIRCDSISVFLIHPRSIYFSEEASFNKKRWRICVTKTVSISNIKRSMALICSTLPLACFRSTWFIISHNKFSKWIINARRRREKKTVENRRVHGQTDKRFNGQQFSAD